MKYSTARLRNAGAGGAILNANSDTLPMVVDHSVFSLNKVASDAAARGAAIHTTGDLIVRTSSFIGNDAGAGKGGAISSNAKAPTASTPGAVIANSTIQGNRAASGGAIYTFGQFSPSREILLVNVTMDGNVATAANGGGGIFTEQIGSGTAVTRLRNTIVSNNTAGAVPGNCASIPPGIPVNNVVTNLQFPAATCASDTPITIGDPKLNNVIMNPPDGLTLTMSLKAGSAASNAGDNATCSSPSLFVLSLDQRLAPRPAGGPNCDIGAYESSLAPGYGSVPVSAATINLSTLSGAAANASVVISETGNDTLTITGYSVTGGPEIAVSAAAAPFSILDGGPSVALTVTCSSAVPFSGSGLLTVTHNATGSPATYTVNCTVKDPLVIATASPLAGATIGVPYSQTLTATGGTPGYVNWAVTVGALTPIGLNLNAATGAITGTPTTAGPLNFTVQVTDSLAVTAIKAFTITVAQASQSITFGLAPTVALGGTGSVSATGGASGNAVTFTSTTLAVCTISGNIVTGVTAGNCTIAANQAGNANYSAAPQVTQNIAVSPGSQTIIFGATPAVSVGGTGSVSATGGASGNAVTFTSTTLAVCTISGNIVTGVTAGICTIAANQAGNASFTAAPQVTQNIAVGGTTQTITFAALPPRSFSTTPQGIMPPANASSGLAVAYTTTTPATCSVAGATFTSVAIGTCIIAANQAGNASFSAAPQVTQGFAITQGTQTINVGGLPNQPLGSSSIAVAAVATSGLAVAVTSLTPTVCATSGINGTTVTLLALGTCTLQGVQAGNANFAAATPVTASFSVVAPGQLGNLSLTSSRNPSVYRSILILTATVRGTNPSGTVSFSMRTDAGAVTICEAVPVDLASATCPISGYLNVTNPTFYTANYSGDANNPAGNVTIQQFVDTRAVTLSVTTTPIPQPSAGATVVLKATVTGTDLSNKVTFYENGIPLIGCEALPVRLLPDETNIGVANCTVPAITAGLHNYVANYLHPFDAGFEQIVVPLTAVAGPADYTDMWWAGVAENGWGVSITQHGRAQFIVLYVYDNSGQPIWYVLPDGTWNAANTAFTGALYQPTSSPFSAYDASKFKVGGVTGASVGSATVTYTGSGSATLTYTINGVSGSKSIVREIFAIDDGKPKLQVGDLWWAGIQQNGWGMNIAQQGRVLFPVWYTYDAAGRNLFYAVPGGVWLGSTFTGDMYTTTSSPWLGVPYNTTQFVITKVGTMTLDFADQSNAVMTYNVNGLIQKKVIVRQPYP